ncbi:MAG: AMP-binding protein, partial [Deltaproteobacteria bacterium]|nr:AMP-binding protein [Deltaproteobacteria bacterium]
NSATGIPRGSIMTSAGFLVQAATAHDYLFAPRSSSREPDKLYCAVELASAAGQCHGVWGPLLNGGCLVIAATGKVGVSRRINRVLDQCSPVAALSTPDRLKEWISQLEKQPLQTDKRFSLIAACRDILTPRLCNQADKVLTEQDQRVINLWIQSETGAALICTFPGKQLNRPGALGLPFPGVLPRVCDERGKRRGPNQGGLLMFAESWPAMLRGIWGQSERFRELYFGRIPGNFSTGDAVRVDASGYYWFMGRRDDVIKVRGFSLRTAEVEAVLQSHSKVTQAVAVGIRVDENDQLVAFVVLSASLEQKVGEETLEEELSESIEARIGDFAIPRRFVFVGQLPRTASGKVTRRVLRRIAAGELARNEDLIHVANRGSIDELIQKIQG